MKTNLHGEASGVCFIRCQIEINIQLPLERIVRDSQGSVWAHIESQIAWGTNAINLCSDKPHHSWNLQPRQTQPPPPRSASLEESITIDLRSSHVPSPANPSTWVLCTSPSIFSLARGKGRCISVQKTSLQGEIHVYTTWNRTLDKISGTIKDSLAKI